MSYISLNKTHIQELIDDGLKFSKQWEQEGKEDCKMFWEGYVYAMRQIQKYVNYKDDLTRKESLENENNR